MSIDTNPLASRVDLDQNAKRSVYILDAAFVELLKAEEELIKPTNPATPLGRFRVFTIAHNIRWPLLRQPLSVASTTIHYEKGFLNWGASRTSYDSASGRLQIAVELVKLAKGQPRRILHILYRIRNIKDWCYARVLGRKRQAEEILRQQARAAKILEEEAAFQALKSHS